VALNTKTQNQTYSASSLKQQSTHRQSLEHIILTPNHPVFALAT